ncbi:hypothetical protein [Aureispira anguillae]|uniref:Uncharacterized protein n=1 Tax=Aureispira anguillae TaxID=2864201 RepID=A0A916DQZ1_9BACT|nr:hypothetical protein [Aureispira anguillae]BDS11484.1 hypothetical protein AsAng_0021980 [Aureispira anguillae]
MDRRKFKGISIFLLIKERIKIELNEFQEIIEEISSDLESKKAKIEASYENLEASGYEDHYSDILIDEYQKYDKTFPKYTFNPLLLSIYGYFENWLRKLCDIDSRKGFSKIKVSDLAGRNYIEKSKTYFQKVAEIDLSILNEKWQRVKEIQKIRNLIAHNESNIVKNKSKPIHEQPTYQIINGDENLALDLQNGDFHIMNKTFLLEAISLVQEYLNEVIEKLSKRKVIAKNTAVPYDMTPWGEEKTESLLKDIIHCLNLIDGYYERDDEHRLEDTLGNLKGNLGAMAWNGTKILSFFMNGKWETIDRDYIVNERLSGLKKLKDLYKKN